MRIYILFLSLMIISGCANTSYAKYNKQVTKLYNYSKNLTPTYYITQNKKPTSTKLILRPYLLEIKYRLSKATGIELQNKDILNHIAEIHSFDMAEQYFVSHLGSGQWSDYARVLNRESTLIDRATFFNYQRRNNGSRLLAELVTSTSDKGVGVNFTLAHFNQALNHFLYSIKHKEILQKGTWRYFGIGAYRKGKKIYWTLILAK